MTRAADTPDVAHPEEASPAPASLEEENAALRAGIAARDEIIGKLLERFCQLSGQVEHRAGLWPSEAVSDGGDQVPQCGHALHVDDPPTGERDGLVDVAGWSQEVADLIKGPA